MKGNRKDKKVEKYDLFPLSGVIIGVKIDTRMEYMNCNDPRPIWVGIALLDEMKLILQSTLKP